VVDITAPPPPAPPSLPPPPPPPPVTEAVVRVSRPSCGAIVTYSGAAKRHVHLAFENVTDETIQIGSSTSASFVDRDGAAMVPELDPGPSDAWFFAFSLPPRTHRNVIALVAGGDPAALVRLIVPDSGDASCTIDAVF
jgi:hypothetical protein